MRFNTIDFHPIVRGSKKYFLVISSLLFAFLGLSFAEETEFRMPVDRPALRALRPAGDETAPDPEELATIRSEWEQLRERVTEVQLSEARAAAALDRAERELRSQQGSLRDASERFQRLGRESEDSGGIWSWGTWIAWRPLSVA